MTRVCRFPIGPHLSDRSTKFRAWWRHKVCSTLTAWCGIYWAVTIVIAIWTWRSDRRRWMKGLGIAALGTVIAQGVLAELQYCIFCLPAISSAHAALGQTFFCVAVRHRDLHRRNWVEQAPAAA